MDYSEIFGANNPVAPVATAGPMPNAYSNMVNPTPDFVQNAQRPPANPQELDRRISGWSRLASRLESDPNLLNSIMMASGALMGPVGRGGGAANWGRALTVGQSAYQQGQDRDLSRKMLENRETRAAAEEKRQQELHPHRMAQAGANVEGTQASTEATRTNTAGQRTRNEILIATKDDAIKLSKTSVEAAERANTRAFNEEEVAALERDVRAIRAYAQRNTAARDVQLAAERAEQALKDAKLNSEKTGLDLKLARITTDALDRMSPQEVEKLVKAKFSGQAGSGSAIVQQMDAWGNLYDKLPPEDPNKQGKTKEQYVAAQIKAAKAEEITAMRKRYVDSGGEDSDILAEFDTLLRQNLRNRGTGDPGAKPVQVKSAADYAKLPKGTEYIDPQGRLRTKQ